MLSSFGTDFALEFGGEDQRKKRDLHRKILGYLITFTRSVVLFHTKAFVVTCFWAKVCWSSSASTKVYSCLGGTSCDLRGTSPKCPSGRWACYFLLRHKSRLVGHIFLLREKGSDLGARLQNAPRVAPGLSSNISA